MKKAYEIENPVALVYRARYGCRKQYVFETVEDFETWAARKPYCDEILHVIPVKDRCVLERKTLAATEAAKYVRGALSDP